MELCIIDVNTIRLRYVTLRIYSTCTIHTYREEMKKKLTLSIEDKLIDLARLDNINISGLLELYLSKYLETNGLEEVDKKIVHVQSELQALIDRKKDILRSGHTETKNIQVANAFLEELQNAYIKRRSHVDDRDADFQWINSPKNQQRCKLLNKEPLQMAMELREWYKSKGGK